MVAVPVTVTSELVKPVTDSEKRTVMGMVVSDVYEPEAMVEVSWGCGGVSSRNMVFLISWLVNDKREVFPYIGRCDVEDMSVMVGGE